MWYQEYSCSSSRIQLLLRKNTAASPQEFHGSGTEVILTCFLVQCLVSGSDLCFLVKTKCLFPFSRKICFTKFAFFVKIQHEYKNTNAGKQIFWQVRKLQIRKFWAHSAIANPQITGVCRSATFVMINPQIYKENSSVFDPGRLPLILFFSYASIF